MRNFAQDRIRAAARVASRTILLFLPALLGLAMPGAFATDRDRTSLKDISVIRVLIESPDPESEWTSLGLTKDSLQTIVELKLRQNGIRIDPKAKTLIYVNINAEHKSANVEVALLQDVLLDRDHSIWVPGVKTWDVAAILLNTTGTRVREYVGMFMDEFLNDWLAANPKDGAK